VSISVRDTGIGITEEQQGRIFVPFVQADTITARRYGGSGLGLAISRQLVALMGGEILVTSVPGAGSTFTMQLTLQSASALPDTDTTRAAVVQPLRVLVAKDNPVNQFVIRRMLEGQGHQVTGVADGHAALEAVLRTSYDVVLMDMQMPELDGEGVARAIRQLPGAVKQSQIIALTASASDEDRERALWAGMDDYLRKPVQPEALEAALARVATVSQNPDAGRAGSAEATELEQEALIDWIKLGVTSRTQALARALGLLGGDA
jgi:CheY-like chemotaxis protein